MVERDPRIRLAWRRGIVFAFLLGAIPIATVAQTETQAKTQLTLTQALEQAFRASPVLRALAAEVRQAEARVRTAKIYQFNPEVEVQAGDRSNSVESTTDWGVGLSQEIQIGGQRGKRVAVASAELEAARSEFLREQRLLSARVQMAFALALRAREFLSIAQTDAQLTRQLLDFSERRLAAGAGTQVALNLARSTSGLAERQLRLAQSDLATARNRFAEEIGLAANESPEPAGDLQLPEDDLPPFEQLLALALENRADLIALRQQTESARQAIRLAKAAAIPNLRLGASYNEEEGTDTIKGLSLSLPIPLFNRNQGRVEEARVEVERLSATGSAAELAIRREVADAFASHRFANEAAETLQDLVVGTLEGNLALLQRALEAGKIGAADILVFRREFVESQRQYVEALTDAWAAHITLDLATGRSLVPTISQQENLP